MLTQRKLEREINLPSTYNLKVKGSFNTFDRVVD